MMWGGLSIPRSSVYSICRFPPRLSVDPLKHFTCGSLYRSESSLCLDDYYAAYWQNSSPRWCDDDALSTGCRWHTKDIPRGSNAFSREMEAFPLREESGPISVPDKRDSTHLGAMDGSEGRSESQKENFYRAEKSAGERGKSLKVTSQGENRIIGKDDHDSIGRHMFEPTGEPPQVGTPGDAVNRECRKGDEVSNQREVISERISTRNEIATEQASVLGFGRAVSLSSRLWSTTINAKRLHSRQSVGRPSFLRNDHISSSSEGNTPHHESSALGSSSRGSGTLQCSGSSMSCAMSLTAATKEASCSITATATATAAAAAAVCTTAFPFRTPGLVNSVLTMRDKPSARHNRSPQNRPKNYHKRQQQQSPWHLSPSSQRQRSWNANGLNDDRGDHSEAAEV